MHLDSLHLTTSIWILVGIYWVATGVRVKPVARRQHPGGRALHVAVMAIAFALLFSSYASMGPLADRFMSDQDWIRWLGFALTVLGCGFSVLARALLGGNWSAAVTVKQSHELVRTGPYALVRHPIYAGFLVGMMGTALVVGEVRALLGFVIAFIGWYDKARREERFLREQFDGEYIEYSRSVKRLIPFIL